MAVWQDGRVVWLAPEEIPVESLEPAGNEGDRIGMSPERVPEVDPEGRASTTIYREPPRP